MIKEKLFLHPPVNGNKNERGNVIMGTYRALYRKWRPQTFDEVYGQPHVTRTLKNELSTGRISHAYLFTGTRGTGKTSCAKILSKAVNCLNPVDGNPCNECEICRGIDSGSILDVIEMDAASNNGVNDVRDLREEANFLPTVAKYRVYIIDEVHMLSTAAFNALLKTLEEPPEHVIFILATTDLQKLPTTILSRCQRFDFKRITAQEIVRRLKDIAAGENVTITDEAANLIANLAEGGMRDAVSLMDRCLSVTEDIDEDTVSDVMGIAGTAYMFRLSDCISKRDFKTAFSLIDELYNGFCDIDKICSRLAYHFRNLMVASSVHNCADLIICSESELEQYKNEAKKFRLSEILECIDIIGKTSASLRDTVNKRIQFESAIIKMCAANGGTVNIPDGGDDRISALERKLDELLKGGIPAAVAPAAPAAPVTPVTPAAPASEPAAASVEAPAVSEPEPEPESPPLPEERPSLTPPPPISSEPAAVKDDSPGPEVPVLSSFEDGDFTEWPEVIENISGKDMVLASLLSDTEAFVKTGKLVIRTTNPALYDIITKKDKDRLYYKELKKAIQDVTGRDIKLVINTVAPQDDESDNSNLSNILKKIKKFNSEGEET